MDQKSVRLHVSGGVEPDRDRYCGIPWPERKPNVRLSSRFLKVGLLLAIAFLAALLLRGVPQTGGPYVLYLGWDSEARVQIFRADLGASGVEQLTTESSDIRDYALSPDHGQIAYATNDGLNMHLWLISPDGSGRRQILACELAYCDSIVWQPDGQRLIYERRDIGDDGIPGITHLWWLDVASGATVPVLEDNEPPSHGASFSPNGQWLSYVGSPDDGIVNFEFKTGRHAQFASEVGTPVVWSPDSREFIFRNNQVIVAHSAADDNHQGHTHDFALGVYLFVANVADDTIHPLATNEVVDDAAPSWRPDGEWIAFGRKQPLTSMGRQLWLVRSDGSEAHPLTDDPAIHHGLPLWSGDGKALLFQRYPVLESGAQPGIWLYEIDSGRMRQIVSPGFQPSWLP